ncbi:uncharacterized protein LOC126719981 [Quercus robur]|uniref:uncharacterized protein LOC126719981 n=1 Tax=Quercus robur TaxID=38942 RepID=UPI0021621107|nr:uncharacterized protein LOC126719981 [Quercus robur]
MDLLVAAATTAAGHIAEFWQSLFPKDQEASLQATGEASTSDVQGTKNEVGVLGSRSRQLRSKSCGHFVKPVNSSESRIAAQLYRESARMEKYVCNSIHSITTLAIRPLLVTDGNQVICRDSSSFKDMQIVSKMKRSIGKGQQSRRLSCCQTRASSSGGDGGAFHSQGSHNGMLLFFLGANIGLISTIVAIKREVDNLNAVLKQAKNLIQDLHEELKINDLYTFKELSNEDFESCGANGFSFLDHIPNASLTELELDKSKKYDGREPDYQEADDSEAKSKIEAELEVELERLELNMKTYSLDRISNDVELDPNFVVDVGQEDLPPLKLTRPPGCLSVDGTSTSTDYTHTADCGVSPRELSIRLHEVIHLQLEARIMELETVLEDTQMRLHAIESEHMISQNNLYVEKRSSTQESPTFMDEGNVDGRPFIINTSGEALDLYIEACEEFTKMTIRDEGAPPETTYNSDKKELNPFHKNMLKGQDGDGTANESSSQCDIIEEKWSRNLDRNNTGKSEDVDEDDHEMAKLLIKQIVEKTRQGSSKVLNAQRMLKSMNKQ